MMHNTGCFTTNATQTLKIYSKNKFSFPQLAILNALPNNIPEHGSSITWLVNVRCEDIVRCL